MYRAVEDGLMQAFDYVIVGAGAAGCVLANRLSEDGRSSVALIEAGADRAHPLITMPKGVGRMLKNPSFTWANATEPEAATGGKSECWTRGKVLGGSTAVNGMIYVRGQPADFDEIAALSSEDWNWKHIGAAYRALESHELGAAATRGDQGPLRISLPVVRDRLSDAIIEAGVATGLPRKEDVNAPDDGEGVGYVPWTVFRGRRQSAAIAFIEPIRQRRNLRIIANAHVDRVLFETRRAVSVEARCNGVTQRYDARREIILCGGALASPGILQRSGVGPAPLLRSLGIEPVFEAPQVGQNLIEHRGLIMQWKLREPLSQNLHFSGLRLLGITAEYFLRRSGPMAAALYDVVAWIKSRPELARPDLQLLIAPFSTDAASGRTKMEAFTACIWWVIRCGRVRVARSTSARAMATPRRNCDPIIGRPGRTGANSFR